jgi:hypothetical protein
MPEESDDLIRDLGAIIAAREAMRIADDVTSAAIDRAVCAAGVAVSKTIHRGDPITVTRARELIAECRRLLEDLGVEIRRARAASAESERISRRSTGIIEETRAATQEIRRRRMTREMSVSRYRAFKFVSSTQEHRLPAAGANTRDELAAKLAKLGDAGYFNVYDYQPPDPDQERERIGGISVEPDGRTRFERR